MKIYRLARYIVHVGKIRKSRRFDRSGERWGTYERVGANLLLSIRLLGCCARMEKGCEIWRESCEWICVGYHFVGDVGKYCSLN